FFTLVSALFPFALGSEGALLQRVGPAIVWVCLLLATTLGLEDIFRADWEDGSLEQLALATLPLPLTCAAKAFAHWVACLLPLIAMAALSALAYGVGAAERNALLWSLVLGTPVFSLVGSIGSALTVGLRGGALLLALLILPLYIPVLIFGAGAVRNATLSAATGSEYFFLAGLSVLAATLAPFATAAGLRARLS
ncbi:MAG: hypothetical protein RL434_426, partial [Pseudomonadota bacterium]